MNYNKLILSGNILYAPTYTHTCFGIRFFKTFISSPRLSGIHDVLPVILPEKLLSSSVIPGKSVLIQGQVRSYNNKSGVGRKLCLYIYPQTICDYNGQAENILMLKGTVSKPPINRTTPYGKEITDLLLAVTRDGGKSDYLPCIAWGSTASSTKGLAVGSVISLQARMQSRIYQKTQFNETVDHTAYEISIQQLIN